MCKVNSTAKYKKYISIDEVKTILEDFRKSLPVTHTIYVNEQLNKKYNTITNTVIIGENVFVGTFKESSERKGNKEAYNKESKMATILAAKGFDVILVEENTANNNKHRRKKPDAIINSVVMDLKEPTGNTRHTLGNNYQDAMKKPNTYGTIFFLVKNMSPEKVFKELEGKTNPHNNGLVIVYHSDADSFQIIDMIKLRAAHERATLTGRASDI